VVEEETEADFVEVRVVDQEGLVVAEVRFPYPHAG
jgi:hypothetical protein